MDWTRTAEEAYEVAVEQGNLTIEQQLAIQQRAEWLALDKGEDVVIEAQMLEALQIDAPNDPEEKSVAKPDGRRASRGEARSL